MGGELTESRFDPMTFGSDTILNYQLSQKLKLIGRGKFNHLTITLTKKRIKIQILNFNFSFDVIVHLLCH
jgi:hypothetical protein